MSSIVLTSVVAPGYGKPGLTTLPSCATAAQWQTALYQFPERTIFHTAAWMEVLASSYGYVPHWFMSPPGTTPQAMIPMAEVNSRLTGRRGVCLPFTDYCAPLANSPESFRQLFAEIVSFGRTRGWKYLELRGGRHFLPEAPASTSYLTHEVPLLADEARMFAGLDREVRTAIRKAEKKGVQVTFSTDAEALSLFYELHQETRRKHGVPPQPYRFFERIREHVLSKELGTVAIARIEGQPVAAGVFFLYGKAALYKFGASDQGAQHLRANNLVFWEAMKRFAQHGLEVLHLGRTSVGNEGLRKFKLGWSAREQRLEYVRYDFNRRHFTTSPDQSSGWHNRVFALLPRVVSRMAGRILYPHLG